MSMKISRVISVALAIMCAGASVAQESENRVAANTDWSVFVENDPTECWAVSAPKESVNTRDGEVVTVRRGDIRLIVFYRPGEGVTGQVMFAGGYPFASGSTVEMKVGDTTFQMFTEGETAWPATPEDDAKFVAAMKRGSDAVVTGRSGRGTQTQDRFSLLGFTAAVDEAGKRCAS
ncbi:invasion associated locus B family protein [Yoonia sp. SS1-5]|uniref:Invasion associated locus B family protein n=1 Tax=Yoonia rhodophyticola TaxID=3137370 RepID=A0AAN0M9D4_9RHOB